MRIQLFYADDGRLAGFIEYVPGIYAWRPVHAIDYLFIHCLFIYPNRYRTSGAASALIAESVKYARSMNLKGVCTLTSDGPWMASAKVFTRNHFNRATSRGRFDLMVLKFNPNEADPELIDWERQLPAFSGWHLFYSNQCPWHKKGIEVLEKVADEKEMDLTIHHITSAEEAKKVPSGFGTFALVNNGKLIEDHYISERRFRTILEKEGL
ncbi:MAG: GNAT family N-acetyltransferase [bacterium]